MKTRVTFPTISYHQGEIRLNGEVIGNWMENPSRGDGFNGLYPTFWEATIFNGESWNAEKTILANQSEGKKVMMERVREYIKNRNK